MDRNRESNRSRRPRTNGLKDSVAADDDGIPDEGRNLKLTESAKKESSSSSSFVYSVGNMSAPRNKRKRHIVQEVQGRTTSADDIDGNTEETQMDVSEDEDDLRPLPISRRSGKSRSDVKPFDDSSAVDLSTVPRKARTVIMKRPHESPPHTVTDCSKRQMAVSLSPASAATVSSNSAALKLARRMKASSSKPRVSKILKVSVSTSISEQEVEVAEALFDLARTLPTQASPSISESNINFKPEPKFEPVQSFPASVLSVPVATSCPVPTSEPGHVCLTASRTSGLSVVPSATAVTSCPVLAAAPPAAEAPKRKCPRVRPKRECEGSIRVYPGVSSSKSLGVSLEVEGELEQTAQSATESVQVKAEASAIGSGSSVLTINGSHTSASTTIPTPSASAQWADLVEEKPSLVGELNPTDSEPDKSTMVNKLPCSVPGPQIKDVLANSTTTSLYQKENEAGSEVAGAGDSFTELELGKSLPHSPSSAGACPVKFEVDLQVSPNPTGIVTNEKTEDSGLVGDAKEQKDLVLPSESIWLDNEDKKGNDGDTYRDAGDKDTGKEIEHERYLGRAQGQVSGLDYEKQGEKESHKEVLKGRERDKGKDDLTKQTSPRTARNNNDDSRLQETEKSGVSSFLGSSLLTSSSATNPSPQVSMGMIAWGGSLPHFGYYSPAAAAAAAVAAAWSSSASISVTSSVDNHSMPALQVPPLISPRLQQLWKHCSRHVYIAHFIDWQEQMQRHPLWATTYANNIAGIYGARSCNLGIPLPPHAMFGSGAGNLTGSSGASSIGHGTNNGSGLKGSAATAKLEDPKDRLPLPYFDSLQVKLPLQQLTQIVPSFPFPVTHISTPAIGNCVPTAVTGTGTATVGTISLIGSTSGSGNGHLISASSGAVTEAGVGTTKGSVVNAAIAQAQFLQAMIQQTGFPFAFPPACFGPAFNWPPSRIAQEQASKALDNLCNTHLVHPALHSKQDHGHGVMGNNISSGFIPSQMHHQQEAALFSLHPSGSPCRRPTPPPPSQSHEQPSGTESRQVQHPLDRENNMGGDSGSTAESKISTSQRNLYNHISSSMQVSSVNPLLTSGMLAIPGHHHNFSVKASVGGKLSEKLQQQHHQASVHLQAQQQSTISSQSQQLQHMVPLSVENVTRNSVDLRSRGLASVAVVMPPQGRMMIQSMSDATNGQIQSLSGQIHQHAVLQRYQQHPVPRQKASSSGAEDIYKNTAKSHSNTGSQGHGPIEDKKMPVKETIVPTGLSSVDMEISSNGQGLPNTGCASGLTVPCMVSSSSAPNLMSSSIGNLTSWSSGQSVGNVPGMASSANPGVKVNMSQVKMTPNTIIPTSSAGTDTSLLASSDQMLGSTLSRAPLGLPFSGSSIKSGCQTPWFQPSSPNVSQLKLAQKPSVGSGLRTSVIPVTGMPKNQGVPNLRSQQPATCISAASKSCGVPAAASIGTFMAKSSFPVSQNGTVTTSGKRSDSGAAPASTSIQGTMAQSTPANVVQPQLQNQHSMQQRHHLSQAAQHSQASLISGQQSVSQQYSQQIHVNQLPNHPMHKQSLQQQQLPMMPQFHLQQFFQQQHLQSSQSWTPAVKPQTVFHSGQPVQHLPMQTGYLSQQQHVPQQQVRKHFQPQQTLDSSQQSQAGVSFETAANGLSLATPNLTLGTGSTGKISPDDGNATLNQEAVSRPATPVKSTGNSVAHLGVSLQKHSNSVPTFLYSHLPSSCSTSGQQQSSSPCKQSGSGFDPVERIIEDKLVAGMSSAQVSQPASRMSLH